ncbi:hypothetical protein [Polaromonas sp. CG9_12]|nr:hypothetical protein [Polaromonas sp. CG9_12]
MGSAQNYFGFPGFFPRQKDNIFIINIDKYIDRPYFQTILQTCQFFCAVQLEIHGKSMTKFFEKIFPTSIFYSAMDTRRIQM